MSEKSPTSPNHEKALDENIGETIVCQMNDIMTTPKDVLTAMALGEPLPDNEDEPTYLMPEGGAFSEEDSLALSIWTKENGDNLPKILSEIGYYPEEITDGNIARLKLCLRTPRFIYAQARKDRTGDSRLVPELADYNESLRETVIANPNMSKKDLSLLLHGAVMWAGLPDSYRVSCSEMIEKTINGARGELVMEQIARSKSAQAAGIGFEATSVEDDVRGVDCRLTVPLQIKNEEITISLPVDVKFDRRQILDLLDVDEEIKPYKIKNGKAVMWAGTTKDDLNGSLMLDEAAAEKKGAALTPIVQRAAEEFYDIQSRRRPYRQAMGNYGLRSA